MMRKRTPEYEQWTALFSSHLMINPSNRQVVSHLPMVKNIITCKIDNINSKRGIQTNFALGWPPGNVHFALSIHLTSSLAAYIFCMPLDLHIKLGPYKFSLQASLDHHGYSMNSGHYTAPINCCGKTFHCNDNKITECNITDTYNSSTTYSLVYKLIMEYVPKDVCRLWHCRVSTARPL